jgi:hypothetical protein
MALRTLGAGLALSALLLVGGCRSGSNYCGPAVVAARPVCPTPGCATPVAVAAPAAPCCNGTPGAVPPPPVP